MGESQAVRTIGGVIIIIGIAILLIGSAIPATSTHTSETCVDSPMGYGQDCFRGSVTTANPMKGIMIGTGIFTIIGGVGVALLSGNESSIQQENKYTQNQDEDSFADKIQKHQDNTESFSDKVQKHQNNTESFSDKYDKK